MAGSEISTMEELIVTISVPTVVFVSTIHL
jgi:hypothetical protein